MNTFQNQPTGITQLTVRPLQRLTAIVALLLAWTLSDQVHAAANKVRFSDPEYDANGLPKCPEAEGFECFYKVRVRDIFVDALKCGKNKTAFGNGCNSPGHFHEDLDFPVFTQEEDCTGAGASAVCKVRIDPLFTLLDLKALIDAEPPTGNTVPLYNDGLDECPALLPLSMNVDLVGVVCDAVLFNEFGIPSCNVTVGGYANLTAPFSLFSAPLVASALCPDGNFTVNVPLTEEGPSGSCKDTSAPYVCSTSFP